MNNINPLESISNDNITYSENNEIEQTEEIKEIIPFDPIYDSINQVRLYARIEAVIPTFKTTKVLLSTFQGYTNHPAVLFVDDVRHKAAQFEPYDMVEITGYICTRRRDEKNQGKNTNYIVGQTIDFLPEDIKTPTKKIRIRSNRINLKGVVDNIIRYKDAVNFYVKTAIDKNIYIVPLRYSLDNKDLPDEDITKDLKVGDVVMVKGTIRTSHQVLNGEIVFYEKYVPSYIQILTDHKYVYKDK